MTVTQRPAPDAHFGKTKNAILARETFFNSRFIAYLINLMLPVLF